MDRTRYCVIALAVVLAVAVAVLATPTPARAQDDLAKVAQNPVAAMISLPFQNNTTFGYGPDDDIQNVLNIQPVWPLSVNKKWNLVTRTIVPVIDQPDLPGVDGAFGLGDVNETLVFSPAAPFLHLQVYVFPTAGQTPEQQSVDEGTCYNWAVQNTGSDPFALQKQAQQQQQQTQQQQQQIAQSGKGSGAVGAVGGAAAGALIGEIASDDAGKGAAYGAAAGLIVGRRQARRAKGQASQQVEQQGQQAQQATAEQIENFKKAFSVCLEAKDYMVKY